MDNIRSYKGIYLDIGADIETKERIVFWQSVLNKHFNEIGEYVWMALNNSVRVMDGVRKLEAKASNSHVGIRFRSHDHKDCYNRIFTVRSLFYDKENEVEQILRGKLTHLFYCFYNKESGEIEEYLIIDAAMLIKSGLMGNYKANTKLNWKDGAPDGTGYLPIKMMELGRYGCIIKSVNFKKTSQMELGL